MTSDDERWERDVRAGLGALLDDVRPGQPPVVAVLRKGRVMRLSRRLAVAGGVAGAVAAAVVVVPVLRGAGQPPVARVGKDGVIAAGRIQGHPHPWQIVVDQKTGRLCAWETGLRKSCAGLASLEHLSGLASLSGAVVDEDPMMLEYGPPVWDALFGVVRPDVTKVVFTLTKSTVSLRPVAVAGYRWVGLMFPIIGPNIFNVDKVTAYSGSRELGYSVPLYGGEDRPGTYFISWYDPGETGPAQQSRYIAFSHHIWDASVDAGPPGYCVSLDAPVADGVQQNCWSPASLRARPRVIMRGGSPPTVPRWIVGTAGRSVAYLRMTLANGRSVKVPVAVFSGQGFYAMQIGPGPAIVRWGAYNAAGHRLYGGLGPPDGGS